MTAALWGMAEMKRLAAKLPGVAIVILSAAVAVGFVKLDAIEGRVETLENNDRFLTCRALENDAGRDPAACRYFLQGNAEEFLPPAPLRRPAHSSNATVP